jgi:predicted nucleotidyltransferase
MSTNPIVDGPVMALFPRTRRAVLSLLYSHPDEAFYLRRIIDITGLAVGQVQRELRVLNDAGVISRFEKDRHVYFRADERCPIFDELRSIVRKTIGAAHTIRDGLEPLSSRIEVAFVYGSVARGSETSVSDLDLMVIGDATFAEVAEAVRDAEHRLRREINLTVYPPVEMHQKYISGHHFIQQVVDREKLFVIGDERELAALLAQ